MDEDDPHSLPLEGRETLRELNARVAAVLDELACSSAASGAVVVYTHDAVRRLVRANEVGHLDRRGREGR
ncbi:MAG: histidine phosphatase family protein [Myxococcales bacterium]|nr:histidine phosphatase family protein [Myxococcales bacterium]